VCTQIATRIPVTGSAKTGARWAAVNEAIVTYDHATHAWVDHAVRLDFADRDDRAAGTVAVELDLASGRALLAQLAEVIAAAERSGVR
jgi:hypothetical protein